MEQFIALILFATIMTFSPGAATVLATGSGARFGIWGTLPLIFGMSSALALLAGLSGLGLTQTLETFPGLKLILTLFGTGYFIWLALKVLNSGSPASHPDIRRIGFLPAVLMLLLNPKAWTMTIGASAAFGALSIGAALPFVMALVFGLSCAISMLFWAVGGVFIGRLVQSIRHWRIINGIIAFLLLTTLVPLWQPILVPAN